MGGGLKADTAVTEGGGSPAITRPLIAKGTFKPSLGAGVRGIGSSKPLEIRRERQGLVASLAEEGFGFVLDIEKGVEGRTSAVPPSKGRKTLDINEARQQVELEKVVPKAQDREEDSEQEKTGGKRKKSKPLKKKKIEGNLVLGMDVQVEDALEVVECTLVGRARGKSLSGKSLRYWAEQQWKAAPVKNFKVAVLVKGWFMVRFESKEAVNWLAGRNWAFGNCPVLFKRWTPLFDAKREKVDEFPVWFRATCLPPFLWVESVFRSIGNLLITFLEADMSFLHTHSRAMARILVCLNPKEGLVESINL